MFNVRRALVSVSDKRGLIPFVQGLSKLGVEILSTGGTCRQLREAGLIDVEARSPTAVLVTRLDPELDQNYRQIASMLRSAGINTEVFSQSAKLGKQLQHGDDISCWNNCSKLLPPTCSAMPINI